MNREWWIDFYVDERSDCTLTTETADVVEFIHRLVSLDKNSLVYDQCCGKGHLSYALAQTGCSVIGVDTSTSYIEFANRQWKNAACCFTLADAREYVLANPADLAINWHTSFAYSESDDENEKMLKAMADSLKVGGRFIISTINPDYILENFQRYIVRHVGCHDSSIIAIRESYVEEDMLKSDWLFIFPEGKREKASGQTKLYRLTDFERMLSKYSLKVKKVFANMAHEPFRSDAQSLILYGEKVG